MAPKAHLFCEKCKKTLIDKEFYRSKNPEKYPNGFLNQCKSCITMHVDNWDPSTYVGILQECDVPYVPNEWAKLMVKYAQDPRKVSGLTIVGRYLAKMSTVQFKDYRWKDSEYLQKLEEQKIRETMSRQGYEAAQIDEVIRTGKIQVPDKVLPPPDLPLVQVATQQQALIDNDIAAELTSDDVKYLCIKWGKSYKPEEWVRLEQLYTEMKESYDIQGAGHEDTLKMICKVSLKVNQLLDLGDIDGAQKTVKMYDQLMKSGNFTAVQNKNANSGTLNSVAEIVTLCEREGFIPRFYIAQPNDKVDETLMDLEQYTHTLVMDEMNLGSFIENALKEMRAQEQKEEDEDVDDDEVLTLDEIDAIKDQDFIDFADFEDEASSEDLTKFFPTKPIDWSAVEEDN